MQTTIVIYPDGTMIHLAGPSISLALRTMVSDMARHLRPDLMWLVTL